jgi:hypothetical protein
LEATHIALKTANSTTEAGRAVEARARRQATEARASRKTTDGGTGRKTAEPYGRRRAT